MSFESEDLPIWIDNSNNKFCVHCSILLPQSNSNNYGNHSQNFNLDSIFMEASEISASSTTTTTSSEWLRKALFSIFKINYLNAFDTVKEDQIDEDALALCENCNQVLINLHQLYNDFLELGKINSYLHKKLHRLDEIIDRHQQKIIKCDLITAPFFQIEEDEADSCSFVNDVEDEPINISDITNKPKNSNINSSKATTTTSLLLNSGREPRILLTRLPEKYTRRQQAENVNDNIMKEQFSDCNSPANSNDDDDPTDYRDVLPKVKIEVDENALVDEDDGDYIQQSPSPSEASNLSDEYQPKSVRKSRQRNKSTMKKVEPTPKRSTRGRPAKVAKNSIKQRSSLKRHPTKVGRQGQSEGSSEKPQPKLVDDSTKIKSSRNKTGSSNLSKNKSKYKKSAKKGSTKSPAIQPTKNIGTNYKIKHCKYVLKKSKYANPCWYCKKFFSTPADCVEHTKQEHLPENCDLSTSGIIICDRCSKICWSDNELRSHLRKCELIPPGEKLPKLYSCPQCPKSFAERYGLKFHIHQVHDEERPFPCDLCSYEAKTLILLQKHKFAIHSAHPVLKCDECDRVVKNELLLKSHKFRMHTPEGQEQYRRHQDKAAARHKEERRRIAMLKTTVCMDCNLDCFSRLAFVIHRRTFHMDSIGEFVCEICGGEFTCATGLRTHKKFVHTDARPFLCSKCGKSFKRRNNLRCHDKRAHTEEGRLAYNQQIRETAQRRRIRENHLAQVGEQQKQRGKVSNIMDNTCNPQEWTNNDRTNSYEEAHNSCISSL